MSMNRRNKRTMYRMANFLKIKNTYMFGSEVRNAWYAKTIGDGRESFRQTTSRVQDQIENRLQEILNSAKETWVRIGYNEKEIKMLEESYSLDSVKNKETLTEDRKLSKKLVKEANKSLLSRISK